MDNKSANMILKNCRRQGDCKCSGEQDQIQIDLEK